MAFGTNIFYLEVRSMKNKFSRYYFLNVQTFGVLLFCHILMASVSFIRWKSDGYFSLILFFQTYIVMPIIMYIICVAILGYWVFQKAVIEKEGIEILFFKKSIKKVDWNTILSIEKTSHMKNPALKIELQNDEVIYLDNRKPIRRAIEFYSGKQIGN